MIHIYMNILALHLAECTNLNKKPHIASARTYFRRQTFHEQSSPDACKRKRALTPTFIFLFWFNENLKLSVGARGVSVAIANSVEAKGIFAHKNKNHKLYSRTVRLNIFLWHSKFRGLL